jgi:hypothetical protein
MPLLTSISADRHITCRSKTISSEGANIDLQPKNVPIAIVIATVLCSSQSATMAYVLSV